MIAGHDNTREAVWTRKIDLIEWFYITFASIMGALKSFLFEDAPPSNARVSSPLEGTRDCVLVIDISGSMLDDDWKPTRLDAAKNAARTFARRLSQEQPNARIAVVVFGCESEVICQLTLAREFDKISRRIGQIDEAGSTNMYAGLKAALDLLKDHARTSQVVLLTDGHNTGRNPEKLADRLKESAIVECTGIGGTPACVDEPLLKRIASAYPDGEKRYRWIGQKEQLVKHFHNLAGAIRRA